MIEGYADSPQFIPLVLLVRWDPRTWSRSPDLLERMGNQTHNRRIRAAAWLALAENLGSKFERLPELTAQGATWAWDASARS